MPKRITQDIEPVAGNGLLHRRLFLKRGAAALGAGSLGLMTAARAKELPPWMQAPGRALSGYGSRSRFEGHVQRQPLSAKGTDGAGGSWTPLESLEGMITPNPLHFERHHSGIPDIDPNRHRLLIHGMVKRELFFDMDSLLRYPMVSRTQFIECSGNSYLAGLPAEPVNATCGALHGLVACSEWTGVPLSILLDEAGVDPAAAWILAEGADAAAMSRSVPLAKAMDDALLAIYQNGERLRPDNGYPLRLFLPGYEGNMSVKWLRRIKVAATPAMTRDETAKYSDLRPDGQALLFTFPMEVKSVITSPSPGLELAGPGLYQISGMAWSGLGRIARVEVSADRGATWAEAALSGPVLDKAVTRFRMAWRWDGSPSVIMSRATDETGAAQPAREALIAAKGRKFTYHYNGIQAWRIGSDGQAGNVYA
ncbi:MAG: sulfite dehydrogenase [Gammaproteobacteria bacterium]|nr:sulfite dehydrogenase [Gammaproteobacteria bacterium]MCY4166367.1 sulfite dehydrogenase [Gammaproteobacteria bacterium]MCY4340283.1 sulfite dehydrogenase [Gammaproteobacteria bacterium]